MVIHIKVSVELVVKMKPNIYIYIKQSKKKLSEVPKLVQGSLN